MEQPTMMAITYHTAPLGTGCGVGLGILPAMGGIFYPCIVQSSEGHLNLEP